MIETGNTTIGVVDVDAPTLLQGCDEGILEKIDWAEIGDKSDWHKGTNSDCGVGIVVYSTSLAYNAATLPNGPTTIADLFDTTNFAGKRGLWKNPATNLEFALLAEGVPVDQVCEVLGTPEGLGRAFAKLDTIKKDVIWWQAGAQAAADADHGGGLCRARHAVADSPLFTIAPLPFSRDPFFTVPVQMFSGIRDQIIPTNMAAATMLLALSILLFATLARLTRKRS